MMRNRCVLWTKYAVMFLVTITAGVSSRPAVVNAQAGDPSTLPLLSSGGLQYLGGFRLPRESSNGDVFDGGGFAIAFNPGTNSLFVSSYYGRVAEVSIPTPAISSDPAALPYSTFLQPFADPTEGHINEATFGYGGGISSLVVSGNRLYGTASIYYDSINEQRVSHYSRSLQLNQPSFSGWSQVGEATKQGYVSGFLSAVPAEWRTRLGGAAIAGQCCIPIVSRTSFGPSGFGFDPTQVGNPTVATVPLVYYDGNHQTLGLYVNDTTPNEVYNQSTEIHGMAIVAGTRTLLYIGRNGLGIPCYGKGTGDRALVGTVDPIDGADYCYDLDQFGKGTHAWPYRYQIWAYDLNDLAAVKAGTKQPWDVVPYGVWPLNLPTPGNEVRLGGVGYDPQRQILYVSQRLADFGPNDQSYRPIIHAFRLDALAAPAPSVTTVRDVTLQADKTAPQTANTSITFTASPIGGVAPYQYKWSVFDGASWTVAADWTPNNRVTWTPAVANANYRVSVAVRSAGNTADAPEASTAMPFAIGAPAAAATATAVTLTANRVAPQAPLTAITWTAAPVGGVAPHQYKWLVSDGTTTTVAANWSTTNSFVWTPSTANANYRVEVWVRSAGNTADAKEASGSSVFPIATIATPGASVASVAISANKAEPQQTGTAIIWSATPSGGTAPFAYKWFVFDGATWNVVANWSSSATFAWTPTVANSNYRVRVWVKAASNPADQAEATVDKGFTITAPAAAAPPTSVAPVTAVKLTSSKTSPQPLGTTIVFTAQVVGGVAPYEYQWFTFEDQHWTAVGSWGSSPTLTWSRNTSDPKYQVQVRVRSAGSNAIVEALDAMTFVLTNGNGNGKK
jgi:hypothetical protein